MVPVAASECTMRCAGAAVLAAAKQKPASPAAVDEARGSDELEAAAMAAQQEVLRKKLREQHEQLGKTRAKRLRSWSRWERSSKSARGRLASRCAEWTPRRWSRGGLADREDGGGRAAQGRERQDEGEEGQEGKEAR